MLKDKHMLLSRENKIIYFTNNECSARLSLLLYDLITESTTQSLWFVETYLNMIGKRQIEIVADAKWFIIYFEFYSELESQGIYINNIHWISKKGIVIVLIEAVIIKSSLKNTHKNIKP